MPFFTYALKLLGLAQTLHTWLAMLTGLDRANRERIAGYCEAIAATLARASQALAKLANVPSDDAARRNALRELGRISGYVEWIVAILESHLDGRKIAGIKRRLEALDIERLTQGLASQPPKPLRSAEIERLSAAEGYFSALADGLRA